MRAAICLAMAGLLTAGLAKVEPAGAESLVEALEHAINSHPEMRRDRAFNRAAEHFVDQNYAEYLPSLDLDFSSGVEWTDSPTTRAAGVQGRGLVRTDSSATLTQMIFDGFDTKNRVASARFDALASGKAVVASGERVAREAAGAYIAVLGAQERLAVAEEDMSELARLAELVVELVDAGRAARVDNEQTISRVAFSQAELASSRGDLEEAVARYTEIVGREPASLAKPDAPDYPEANDLDAAISAAMDGNPEALATGANFEARKAEIEVARAPYAPRFDLEVSGGWDDNQDGTRGEDQEFSVLLRMRWNLFNGFGDLARVRAATFDSHAAARDDGEVRRIIREAVRVAYLNLQTAIQRLEPLRGDAGAAGEVYTAYLDQFDIGTRSLLDLLDARNDLTDAEQARITGEYDVLRAHYDLLFAMGRLLSSQGVHVEPGDANRHHLQVSSASEIEAAGQADLAAVLADWSAPGVWMSELAESEPDPETAGALRDSGIVQTDPTAELPTRTVDPLPIVRGLNQLAEKIVEPISPAIPLKSEAARDQAILPLSSGATEAAPPLDQEDQGEVGEISALEALGRALFPSDGKAESAGGRQSLAAVPIHR